MEEADADCLVRHIKARADHQHRQDGSSLLPDIHRYA